MKFKMARNSLFGVLLRSPWWVSLLIAAAMALLAGALLPADFRTAGMLSGFPFIVVAAIAAQRQWRQPSATQVAQTQQATSAMAWPAFAALLEEAFRRQGHTVQRGHGAVVDFTLERQGRQTLVSARRWKSARLGVETLRALQAAREAADAADALCICLGELTDSARPFAAEHRIQVWQAADLAQALRGLVPRST